MTTWRVIHATSELTAPKLAALPAADRPELAFARQSNAANSSLVNALSGATALARTSKQPGRTQRLNSFAWTLLDDAGTRVPARCIGLPGYGFAAVRAAVRDAFAPMVESDLLERTTLRA